MTTTHRPSESALDYLESQRQFHRDLLRAETAIKEGARRRMHLTVVTGRTTVEQARDQAILDKHGERLWREKAAQALDEHEQAMAGFGGPRIPRRSQRLSWPLPTWVKRTWTWLKACF